LVCKKGLYNEYLYYAIIYFNEDIKAKGRGVIFKEISKRITEQISIPVPPLPIQEQIVAELDKINEVIADNRELLKKLDALEQALFYDTFGDPVTNPKGWKVAPLSQLVTEKLSYGSGASGIPYNGEIRYKNYGY
jgi:type I restriction enzyme S subunit